MAFLALGHGGLAVLCLLAHFIPGSWSSRAVRVLAAAGAVLGLSLLGIWEEALPWRTLHGDEPAAWMVGLATAVAWLLVATIEMPRGRAAPAALVGVGSCGLLLFAAGGWLIPALLFWACSSVALALLLVIGGAGMPGVVALFLSDLLLVLALSELIFGAGGTWEMAPIEGTLAWLALAAVTLRAGIVPVTGIWTALGRPAAPALPLLVGGAFCLLTRLAAVVEPWAAAGLVLMALAAAAHAVLARRALLVVAAIWPVSLAFGVALIDPLSVPRLGAAAVLAAGVLAVWPGCSGRAGLERGIGLSMLPGTAGFAVVAAGAGRAFGRATEFEMRLEAVPWTVIAAVLPVALALGLALVVRAARGREPETFAPAQVVGLWLILALSVALGLFPGRGPEPFSAASGEAGLIGLAALAGAAAAWLGRMISEDRPDPVPEDFSVAGVIAPDGSLAAPAGRTLVLVGAGLGLTVVGAVALAALEGLRVGFL